MASANMRASCQGRSWPRPVGLSARTPPANAIDIPIDAPIAVHIRLRVFFSITLGSIRAAGRSRQEPLLSGDITSIRGPDDGPLRASFSAKPSDPWVHAPREFRNKVSE